VAVAAGQSKRVLLSDPRIGDRVVRSDRVFRVKCPNDPVAVLRILAKTMTYREVHDPDRGIAHCNRSHEGIYPKHSLLPRMYFSLSNDEFSLERTGDACASCACQRMKERFARWKSASVHRRRMTSRQSSH